MTAPSLAYATIIQYERFEKPDGTDGFVCRDILKLGPKPLCGATMREMQDKFVEHSTKYDAPDTVWHMDFRIER